MSLSTTDDKSNKMEGLLKDTNADDFVKLQLTAGLPGDSFKFGSTYPFSRQSLQKLASDLSTLFLLEKMSYSLLVKP